MGRFETEVLTQPEFLAALTACKEKLIKIGTKVVHHARKVVFQMAEVAVPRELFRDILRAIERLRVARAASG
jgi:hypothetical protein